ncbi:ABC transporter ATP-binding protein [Arthrobacter sp.]|uniref:ABC transporter ATP-binding protein n=1 Tax=Arthrobacter sp. TaxID=1667 RepID=UPI0026E052C8|nr:ABC transporter ATP-binding protein [Arthrobacter sp.]MDO5754495.1 ABC transporter ATP-binding protein [Arthrobacter sp.]
MPQNDEPGPQLVLEVEDLAVAYGERTVVDGVSFHINPAEIFGLLGPNGAGKTSTLSAIEGLLTPRAGTVLVDGIDVQLDPLEARSRLGVQLQSSSFQPELSILQIAALFAGLHGVRSTPGQVRDGLAAVGLGGELDRRYKQLSGGQQQRLALFIATVHKPLLLLLDEPTAGLDPQARRHLWDHIGQLRAEGRSILLTTHSMEEAQSVCSRVAILDHGRLLTEGTPASLIAKHRNDPAVLAAAHGEVTLEDVFIGLTGGDLRV